MILRLSSSNFVENKWRINFLQRKKNFYFSKRNVLLMEILWMSCDFSNFKLYPSGIWFKDMSIYNKNDK